MNLCLLTTLQLKICIDSSSFKLSHYLEISIIWICTKEGCPSLISGDCCWGKQLFSLCIFEKFNDINEFVSSHNIAIEHMHWFIIVSNYLTLFRLATYVWRIIVTICLMPECICLTMRLNGHYNALRNKRHKVLDVKWNNYFHFLWCLCRYKFIK